MKKKLYFGSNFKMYKNSEDTINYFREFNEKTKSINKDNVQFFFIPSFTSLENISKSELRKQFLLGAQNMSWEESGQFTGEISPLMLNEMNLDFVMLGHSERRNIFKEDNYVINRKVLNALNNNLNVLLCVGETLQEKDFNITKEVIYTQLKVALNNVPKELCHKLWIAYEPVWSIGVNGVPASAEYAGTIHKIIRECLIYIFNNEQAKEIPILYGGSVNMDNYKNLINQEDIDGLFMTRTAFDIDNFVRLIENSIIECENGGV